MKREPLLTFRYQYSPISQGFFVLSTLARAPYTRAAYRAAWSREQPFRTEERVALASAQRILKKHHSTLAGIYYGSARSHATEIVRRDFSAADVRAITRAFHAIRPRLESFRTTWEAAAARVPSQLEDAYRSRARGALMRDISIWCRIPLRAYTCETLVLLAPETPNHTSGGGANGSAGQIELEVPAHPDHHAALDALRVAHHEVIHALFARPLRAAIDATLEERVPERLTLPALEGYTWPQLLEELAVSLVFPMGVFAQRYLDAPPLPRGGGAVRSFSDVERAVLGRRAATARTRVAQGTGCDTSLVHALITDVLALAHGHSL